MPHTYYAPQDGVDFYPRSKQEETPLSVSRSARSESQRELSDGGGSRVSPVAELDSKSRPGPPRRRIQVACGRCRKRKIKCSGDSGDGQGCTNCRSSGTPNCQFLRVNSSALQTKTDFSGWPYPAIHSSQLGSFAKTSALPNLSPTLRSVSSSSSSSSSCSSSSSSRQSNYDLGTSFSRSQYPLHYNINYDDDPSAMFNLQSSAYTLPNVNSSVMVGYCGTPGSPKTWSPVPPINKMQNGGQYSDQDSASPMAQPSYPYIAPSSHIPPSSDIPPLFPAITSLSSNCQGSDRTLPNPTTRGPVLNGSAPLATLPESLSLSGLSFPPGQSCKAGNPWAPKRTPSTNSQSSTRTMSSSSGGASASSVNGTKTASSSPQDMVFGYIPMTSGSSPPAIASNAYRGADMVDPTDSFQTGGTDSGLTRSMSREGESLLSLGSCSPNFYGYSTGEKSRRRGGGANSGSSGTLMNGMQYIRLAEPDPPHSSLMFSFPHPDAIADAHRRYIPSLSHLGGY
ncbi:hypothetical protein VTN02DRAFT_3938 [Thermoascus thermophilus]